MKLKTTPTLLYSVARYEEGNQLLDQDSGPLCIAVTRSLKRIEDLEFDSGS